jgi:hypothetical protein
LFIPDPEPPDLDFFYFFPRIPDSRIKKEQIPDLGSRFSTLIVSCYFFPVSRLKSTQCGISVQSLIDWYNNQPDQPDDSQFVSGESASLQVMELK